MSWRHEMQAVNSLFSFKLAMLQLYSNKNTQVMNSIGPAIAFQKVYFSVLQLFLEQTWFRSYFCIIFASKSP